MKKIIILFCFLFAFQIQANENNEVKLLLVCNASKVALKNSLNGEEIEHSVKYKKTTSLVKGNYFYVFKLLDLKSNIICQYPDVNEIDKDVLKDISKLRKVKDNIYKAIWNIDGLRQKSIK